MRILGLGHRPGDLVQADVYLLTGDRPALLPAPGDDGAPGSCWSAASRRRPGC